MCPASSRRSAVWAGVLSTVAAEPGPHAQTLVAPVLVREHLHMTVEVLSADLQRTSDVALSIAADWFDNRGVDQVTDKSLSSAACAIGDLVAQKEKVAIFTGGASAEITVAQMKAMPRGDPLFGKRSVRADGRASRDVHRFEMKSPEASKAPWHHDASKRTIAAADAFRPISRGGCPMIRH